MSLRTQVTSLQLLDEEQLTWSNAEVVPAKPVTTCDYLYPQELRNYLEARSKVSS